jgi:hypothetical protein
MDGGAEEPRAAALGALAVAGMLGDVGDQARIVFQKWRWSCLYRPSKGRAVDTQADNDVVHLGRFRQADGLAHQALHACPSRQMLPLDLLRIPLAWAADRPQGLGRPARQRLGVVPARSYSGPPSTPSHTMRLSPP